MPEVLVHKAVEPDNLSVAGKKRLKALTEGPNYTAILQPKLDGVYAQFAWNPASNRWVAYSRTGQELKSVPPGVFRAFETVALVNRRYIGELWVPHTAHSEINGRARSHTEQDLELHLFDSVYPEALDEPYSSRQQYLFAKGPVRIISTLSPLPSLDLMYDLARDYTLRTSAYDGLILRDPDGTFKPGAGKDGETIKIKPRSSGDFRVVGTTAGKGNRAGGIGALIVDLGGGVTCEVGTGLTAEQAREEPGAVIGRIAEVEYLSLTREGKLREPSFKAYRFDKDTADFLHEYTED